LGFPIFWFIEHEIEKHVKNSFLVA